MATVYVFSVEKNISSQLFCDSIAALMHIWDTDLQSRFRRIWPLTCMMNTVH